MAKGKLEIKAMKRKMWGPNKEVTVLAKGKSTGKKRA